MISRNAKVEDGSLVHSSSFVWDFSVIRSKAKIGRNVTIGQFVYVGTGVEIGENCKIQNGAYLYEPAKLNDGVFIGPKVVLTNDKHPRAINGDSSKKLPNDWSLVGVTIDFGASIGAGSICVAPLKIGKWAMIAAGSVVIQDVPDYALVAGNPARQIGWVGESGRRLTNLEDDKNSFYCSETSSTYTFDGFRLIKND